MLRSLAIASVLAAGTASAAGADPDFIRQTQDWQATRAANLKAPDGWLSLIGLEWLKEGANRVGSAADNDIVLHAGPAHLGTVTQAADGSLSITLASGSGATVDGKHVASAPLIDDMHASGKPTTVAFGSASFFAIERDGKKALRVKDENASTRTGFLGLDYFPIDASWRVEATWVPFDPPHELEIGSVLGTVNKEKVPGKAVFTRDGHTFELYPIQEDADSLFFVFADRTSGKETYGAARFITTGLPKDGKVVVDFNQAYNPPCAFTPFATCPLAPPENRLDLRVTAGELKYRGSHH
ncbi:MAG TPA: DUF1684 domain-containing protein [Pinirhizobacter sp.]|uniref:DUF1684 domain-containing protein n=1 Tax=Pinirhizobacter sp. TaxID=2950432 RepID=UPI002C333F1A|nr:DUF1684 domain-containing protein [Pinirhizobacter sp.]HMH66934.1 DUF1684 domain-containing protein [Pinirhizobacter sp.]